MMTYPEFRDEMRAYRDAASRDAVRMKESNRALRDLNELYSRFDEKEKAMADKVLIEWLLSDDEGPWFDAESVVRDFSIAATIPALQDLLERLSLASSAGAPYEREKVIKIMNGLRSGGAT